MKFKWKPVILEHWWAAIPMAVFCSYKTVDYIIYNPDYMDNITGIIFVFIFIGALFYLSYLDIFDKDN